METSVRKYFYCDNKVISDNLKPITGFIIVSFVHPGRNGVVKAIYFRRRGHKSKPNCLLAGNISELWKHRMDTMNSEEGNYTWNCFQPQLNAAIHNVGYILKARKCQKCFNIEFRRVRRCQWLFVFEKHFAEVLLEIRSGGCQREKAFWECVEVSNWCQLSVNSDWPVCSSCEHFHTLSHFQNYFEATQAFLRPV